MGPLAVALLVGEFAMKAGSAIAGHAAQKDEHKQNKRAALEALSVNRRETAFQRLDHKVAAGQQIRIGRDQAAGAAGDTRAAAAASGVAGQAVQGLLSQITGESAAFSDSVRQQLESSLLSLDRSDAASVVEAKSRIAMVPKPSLLATGLQIAGAGLGLGAAIKMNRPPGT